jgi:hypothetical protein
VSVASRAGLRSHEDRQARSPTVLRSPLAAIAFAVLINHPVLTAGDFLVI